MPSPTTCAITGTIRNTSGTLVSGAVVSVNSIKPFIHPTDNSLVVNYSVYDTTTALGTFSLSVIETTTPAVSLILTIEYPMDSTSTIVRQQYYITVPNSASATLASLISGQ